MISIIYPVRSLSCDKKVLELIAQYNDRESFEHIIISSDPKDQFVAHKIVETQSRAVRMNLGARVAKGSIFLFHHPRSSIQREGLERLKSLDPQALTWGGFTHCFDKGGFLFNFTSFYSNYLRFDVRNIVYLDHCIFATKELFTKANGFKNLDIFEDTQISRDFCRFSKPVRFKELSETSSIRFDRNGFWTQAWINFKLKYFFMKNKESHRRLNELYEKNMNLNSLYSKDK